ncbi:MAG: hypothetical protein M3Y86_11955, partial [Verrucomicrobiota bacterium]|nr:hypothetical protein [Verrucomicrobiota bacterium]
ADLLSAICSAVKKYPKSAPQIGRVAATARPEMAKDILRTIFRCLGSGDCNLLGRTLRGIISAVPNDASGLTSLAVELAPDCAGALGGGGTNPSDEGNYGNVPLNQNPPPGSIGGGGGQGTVVAVCVAGVETRFFSPEGAQDFLKAHKNDGTHLGPCVVTPVTNQ